MNTSTLKKAETTAEQTTYEEDAIEEVQLLLEQIKVCFYTVQELANLAEAEADKGNFKLVAAEAEGLEEDVNEAFELKQDIKRILNSLTPPHDDEEVVAEITRMYNLATYFCEDAKSEVDYLYQLCEDK